MICEECLKYHTIDCPDRKFSDNHSKIMYCRASVEQCNCSDSCHINEYCGTRIMCSTITDLINKGIANERLRLIKLIEEHQIECDKLRVIATAEWVKDQIKESNEIEWEN